MQDSRTKNSIRNIVWGMVNRIIGIVMPFLMRTLLIYFLGIEYIGLNSLFSSVLGILNLAELGIGSALTFSMYAPAANEDKKTVSALLNFYRQCYKTIGIIILIIGLSLMLFLRYFIHGEYPTDINIYLLYCIYLFNTIISYFMFAYKGAILTVYQRNDIKSNIATFWQIFQYVVQIILLLVFKNYYIYIIVSPFITIGSNLMTAYFVDMLYPQIICIGEIDSEAKTKLVKKIKGMFLQKIGNVVLVSADNIVISAFLGLSPLALYNNYYMIVTSLFGILVVIMNSIIPSIGNAINTKTLNQNYDDFSKFNFIYVWIVSWFSVCLLCLYQPFMLLWMNNKSLMLPNKIVFLFVCYFFVYKWMDMNYVYQEAAGLWWENRYVPIIAAIVNLTLNIYLVRIYGLSGVLISTIISILLVYDIGYIRIIFNVLLKKDPKKYIIRQFYYAIVSILVMCFTYKICLFININSFQEIIIKGIICIFIPNLIFVVFYHKLPEFKKVIYLLRQIINESTHK